jgi:hypothetical protein
LALANYQLPVTNYQLPATIMEHCVFHPTHTAVEHCEVCSRALCGHCLWYGEDGRRLCATHAREAETAGQRILPPETYAEAINSSLVARKAPAAGPQAFNVPYRGNNYDLNALLAAVMALTTLVSCMGGIYCLPLLAAVIGGVAYSNAASAVDPNRTRVLAGVSLGIGGFMLFAIFAYIAMMFMFFALSFMMAARVP